jgi:hypothetical protein
MLNWWHRKIRGWRSLGEVKDDGILTPPEQQQAMEDAARRIGVELEKSYRRAEERAIVEGNGLYEGTFTFTTKSLDRARTFRTVVKANSHEEAYEKALPELFRKMDEYRAQGGF